MDKNKSKYILVRPDNTYREEWNKYCLMLKTVDKKIVPSSLEAENFEEFLTRISELRKGENLPVDYVPADLYFFVSLENKKKILGVVDIRLEKNELLNKYFGQAGGSILPSERGKGLGIMSIYLAMQKLKEKGFSEIILTCEMKNIASKKSIMANGGIFIGNSLINKIYYERYLINLDNEKNTHGN